MHVYLFIYVCCVNVIGSRGIRSFIYSVYCFTAVAVATTSTTTATVAAADADAAAASDRSFTNTYTFF